MCTKGDFASARVSLSSTHCILLYRQLLIVGRLVYRSFQSITLILHQYSSTSSLINQIMCVKSDHTSCGGELDINHSLAILHIGRYLVRRELHLTYTSCHKERTNPVFYVYKWRKRFDSRMFSISMYMITIIQPYNHIYLLAIIYLWPLETWVSWPKQAIIISFITLWGRDLTFIKSRCYFMNFPARG